MNITAEAAAPRRMEMEFMYSLLVFVLLYRIGNLPGSLGRPADLFEIQ